MSALRLRILAFLAGSSVFIQCIPIPALAFSDVSTSVQYSTAIHALQKDGVLEGYSDGTFKANNHINRAEFLKIILEERGTTIADATANCFPDVHSEWFAKYICAAKNEGIVSGYPDGKFYPEKNVSFVEAGKILALAYKQSVDQYSPDWYEPYARALESSKAIPPSISKLDDPITRGEMAEMMWRLSENKTDQASKGYLNVKYPSLSLNMSNDKVQIAKSCTDLQAFASEAGRTNSSVYFYGRGGGMLQEGAMNTAAPAAAPREMDSKASNQSGNYSQTNVQVEGVDEADIVKTDGNYLYFVRNADRSTVRIVKINPANDLKEVAKIDFGEDQVMPQDLYVENGKLIVIGQRTIFYAMPMMRSMESKMIAPDYYPGHMQKPRVDVRIYSISDPTNPKHERTLSFDGNTTSTRRIGNKLYLVLNQPVYWGGPIPLLEKDLIPNVEDSKTGKTTPITSCNRVSILPHIPSPQYMTVAVIRTDDMNAEPKTAVVLGNAENVYSSLKNLYVANTEWTYNWKSEFGSSQEKTNLYRFEFSDTGIDLKTQGSVPGRILNQFSMDEKDNTFRIATTQSAVWTGGEKPSKPASNNLYILNTAALEKVGEITNIAPGETIYSARFMGDRAYLVTFKTVDPFFVVDVSDARNPKILGQLKIPGYSQYLHPYDDTHVIGFGKEVDASIDADKVHSDDAVYYTAIQGLKISLFDVTDVSKPTEMFKTVIGDRGTESAVLQNHKALLFEKDRGLLSFPVLVTKIPDGQPKNAEANPVFQGAYVYNLSLKNGFTLKGTITHYDDPDVFTKSGGYWYNIGRDIDRIVRVGNSLITLSQASVRSHTESSLKEEGKVEIKQ
jgi:uncharacterized secreted protein with C-terminal beta-propeller domain